ncbi:hypothetical protein BGZ81_004989 [Podila clonocystis]|nr:hypothetical protein BGZ81_004989 [Podila clonocystis]
MGHENFPEGREFSISLRDTDLVLDVSAGSTEPGTPIIIWTAKQEDNANQKWYYENKQLRNKQTGLYLTVPHLNANVAADQQHSANSDNQRFEYDTLEWFKTSIVHVPLSIYLVSLLTKYCAYNTVDNRYYDYTISAAANEDLVLGILGNTADGARLALVPRDNDSELQQWSIRF